MRRVGVLVFGALVAGCVTEGRPSPLAELGDVTRIEVSRRGQPAYSFQLPSDSLRIAMITEALRSDRSAWRRSSHTLPAGDVTLSFIQDTALIGVVWLGREVVVARGSGEALFTNITSTAEIHLRALLNPVTVVGTIGNETPKPPQN